MSPDPTSYTFTAESGVYTTGGIEGSYYPQPDFGGTPVTRVDPAIDFDWGAGDPGIAGFPADGFSVRWEGFITVPADYEDEFRDRVVKAVDMSTMGYEKKDWDRIQAVK